MLDSLTYSADGLIILSFIIFWVIFFLNWPHKVYEALIWALIGTGAYLLVYELTFVNPEFTRTLVIWNWLIDNRGTILWVLKLLIGILYLMTPVTIWVNVSWELRGTGWFLVKTVILSAFFVSFGCALLALLTSQSGLFSSAILFSKPINDYPYFQTAGLFTFFQTHALVILLAGFFLGIYKILISHWSGRLLLIGGVIYAKWSNVFWKKTFDTQWPLHDDDPPTEDNPGSGHDDHH